MVTRQLEVIPEGEGVRETWGVYKVPSADMQTDPRDEDDQADREEIGSNRMMLNVALYVVRLSGHYLWVRECDVAIRVMPYATI